jgi:hypothetical protein
MANKVEADGQVQDTWHIRKGATFIKQYTWKNGTEQVNTPTDLTGWSARAKIKAKITDTVSLVDLETGVGGEIVLGGVLGTINITIPDTVTQAITVKTGVFDLELVNGDASFVRNLVGGDVIFYEEVTK